MYSHEFPITLSSTGAVATKVIFHMVTVQRSMPWDNAFLISSRKRTAEEGFYLPRKQSQFSFPILLTSRKSRNDVGEVQWVQCIIRPDTGLQPFGPKERAFLSQEFEKNTAHDIKHIELLWQAEYMLANVTCKHRKTLGECKVRTRLICIYCQLFC